MVKFIKVTAVKDGKDIGRAVIAVDAIDAFVDHGNGATEVILRSKEGSCIYVRESYNDLVAALS